MKKDEFSNVIMIFGISVKFLSQKISWVKILQVEGKKKRKKMRKNHKGGRILKK